MQKQTSPRQALALVAMLAAAIGSAASTSGGDDPTWGSWTVTEPPVGSQILLTSTAGSAEKSVVVSINAAGTSDDELIIGSLIHTVNACMTGDTAGLPTLRILLISDKSGNGEVFERPVPVCPAIESFAFDNYALDDCAPGLPCEEAFTVAFERRALTTNSSAILDVNWTVTAEAYGSGDDDIAPTGTDVTLEVQP